MKLLRMSSRPMSRDKADTLLLLATSVLVLAPHAAHLPTWVVLACSALLLWRGWITFRGNRMPPRLLLLPIAVLAMAGVYLSYKTIFGREVGVAMLALLLTFKLLEMHAKRDLFVLLFLSFFLVLTGFFYSQGIGTALLTIASSVAIVTTQLTFQYTGVVPPLGQRLRFGAFILLLAAPLTLVLFLLFPRIQGPLWGTPTDTPSARSGLSDSMSPGNISRLALSDSIAFRVRFIDEPPAKSKLYWRGPVLSAYDGRTWTSSKLRVHGNRRINIHMRGAPIRYQVTLEPSGRNWLFALDVPQAVPQLANNPAAAGPDLELLTLQPINERVRYDASSVVDFDLQLNETPRALQQALDLPQGFNPRTIEFAANVRNNADSEIDMVNTVIKFFRQENFRYTLEPPMLGTHAVDEFLFDSRAGFCEHYAGAFVVLMRVMGIPARVVTGYQGGEITPADGFMEVRQSDAHAWAEVWLQGRGWIRIDPTAAVAPDRIEMNLRSVIPRQTLGGLITLDGAKYSWFTSWRQNWDAVTNAWNQWVLNYTPERQKNLIQSLGFDHVDWRTLIVLMFAAGIAIMAIVVLPLVMNRSKAEPVEALYRALSKQLARYGCERKIHEGPRAYGIRLTAADSPLPPEKKAAVARFLEYYEAARYGSADIASPASVISTLKSLLIACR